MSPARSLLRTSLLATSLCTLPLAAQERRIQHNIYKIEYKCPPTGRFLPLPTVSRTTSYCFDGTYYNSSTVPPAVRAYFAQLRADADARMKAVDDKVKRSLAMAHSPHPRRSASPQPGPSVVQAANKPDPIPVPLASLRVITIGESAAAVRAALAEPHSRIAGLATPGEELWTYVTDGGAFAKIRIRDGVVQSVHLPQ
jgi:hypothetical protein